MRTESFSVSALEQKGAGAEEQGRRGEEGEGSRGIVPVTPGSLRPVKLVCNETKNQKKEGKKERERVSTVFLIRY